MLDSAFIATSSAIKSQAWCAQQLMNGRLKHSILRFSFIIAASSALLPLALSYPLQAQPTTGHEAACYTCQAEQPDPRPALAQASTPTVQEQPGPRSKVEETAKKKGQPSVYGTVTKPGFFAIVEQTSGWNFPSTGASWGTGSGAGATFLGFGVSGSVQGTYDNLLNWSLQLGPLFQHTYNVPGNDRTPLRMDASAFLSPLKGDDLNIYAIWRGIAGADGFNQTRFTNTVRSGILFSFMGSRIIPDAIELINLPEKGFYVRVEPSWAFGLDGQLSQVTTQAYLGLSETYYPFTFAVEVGPQFVQVAGRELQTNLGSFFDFGYLMSSKTRAFVRYRPSLSFGGSQYPAAGQLFQAGVSYRF